MEIACVRCLLNYISSADANQRMMRLNTQIERQTRTVIQADRSKQNERQ